MKLFKSLLLASATGLVAVSGASAADLGAKKPSPVEYVRACYNPLWGTSGGFVIPGTQTCVRVFGQASFQYGYVQQFQRTGSPSGFRGGAVIGLDAITPSEYGNVRAFAQVGMNYRTGNQASGTASRQGTGVLGAFNNGGSSAAVGGGGTEFVFSGFVQFAGITAGRTASFFDPFFVPEIIGTTFRSSPGNVNLIAYTAALGNGLTATVSVEDPTTRRQGILNGTLLGAGVGGLGVVNYTAAGATAAQGGIAVPHVVAALQLDQAWGSAKVAGAVTNVRSAGLLAAPGFAATIPSTKYGYAVMGALKVNLPMIAAGDNFVVTGAFGEGALSHVTSNFLGGASFNQGIGNGPASAASLAVGDASFDNATGRLRLVKAWSVAAGFQHFWTPTLSSTIFGSYAAIDVPFQAVNIRETQRDAKFWTVGVNTIWQPVRGLNIGLEGAYVNFDPKGRIYDVNRNSDFAGNQLCTTNAAQAGCFTKSQYGFFQTRLRITRDF